MRFLVYFFLNVSLWLWMLIPQAFCAWTVTPRTQITMDATAVGSVSEMSGVVYLGLVSGEHRFAAVQDGKGDIVQFSATFGNDGSILTAVSISETVLPAPLDYEGIIRGNAEGTTVFLSEENSPKLHEINLSTGAEVQAIDRPAVFNARRANFGFESLARQGLGNDVWTANEEALTVDGELSTSTAGTTVRLLHYTVAGTALTAGAQYAYVTDPIPGTSFSLSRSGVSELVLMPNGELLALERSLSITPGYENRIYAIDFANATNISTHPFDDGLIGETYQPVGKTLLWSGPVGGSFGENLEGLTVGPKLANGNYVLVGVVDNGDGISSNHVVSFEATLVPVSTSADFDQDGDVDGSDFLAWQSGFGVQIGAQHSEGDADGDGDVDSDDLVYWNSQFGEENAATDLSALSITEPQTLLLALAMFCILSILKTSQKLP